MATCMPMASLLHMNRTVKQFLLGSLEDVGLVALLDMFFMTLLTCR